VGALVDDYKLSFSRRLIFALITLLMIARLASMAILPLMDTTEARYAEIGRKMVELGDWVTPWNDYGSPFWGKPPLSFWLTAMSFKLFGVNEFVARLPHFFCGLLIGLLVWWLARLRARRVATVAIAVLSGSVLFFVSAGAVMTDAALTLGTALAMVGFWMALSDSSEATRRRHGWLLFVGIALGLLAKGPIAVILITTPLFLWTLFSHRWNEVSRLLPWVGGLILVVVIAAPWYVLAELRTPGFLQYFIVGEHWYRFVTPDWTGDLYGSAHRFVPGTIWVFGFVAMLPWSLLVPVAARRWRNDLVGTTVSAGDRTWRRYLLLWALTPLLFFTAARNILWTYLLPAMPAIALLVAEWIVHRIPPGRVDTWVGTGLVLSLLAVTSSTVYYGLSGRTDGWTTKPLVKAFEQKRLLGQPLIFVGTRPPSAAFYSRGEAIQVNDAVILWQRLGDRNGFVAVGVGSGASLGEGRERTVSHIGRFGSHDLLFVAQRQQSSEGFRRTDESPQ
jgi:4-amino-4-deoxy-L-arabinose transferase-like glycosyltransferase